MAGWWWTKSAEKGNFEATANLCILYLEQGNYLEYQKTLCKLYELSGLKCIG